MLGDESAFDRFKCCRPPFEDALAVQEAELAMLRRLAHHKTPCSTCRAVLRCTLIIGLDA